MSFKRPFFIIANPRSGSTLLRLMLTSHPNICVPPECGWVVGKYDKYNTQTNINYEEFVEDFFDSSTKKIETWELTKGEVLQALLLDSPKTYSELVGVIYRLYITKHQPGKTLWGDKNNFYTKHLPELLDTFPDAKYIFLVRDGRDVAVSYMDMQKYGQKYAPKVTSDPVKAFEEWADTVLESEKQLNGSNHITVRYENLVSSPEEELRRVCDFLGEEYSSDMLFYYENNYEPEATMAWKMKTKEPPSTSQIGRWKGLFTEGQIHSILNIISSRIGLREYLYKGAV